VREPEALVNAFFLQSRVAELPIRHDNLNPHAEAWGYMLSPLRGDEDSQTSYRPGRPPHNAATD
jgi:hypothetical protein